MAPGVVQKHVLLVLGIVRQSWILCASFVDADASVLAVERAKHRIASPVPSCNSQLERTTRHRVRTALRSATVTIIHRSARTDSWGFVCDSRDMVDNGRLRLSTAIV